MPNDIGESLTESRVAFEANGKILVGKHAVGKANHIYDVKRIMRLFINFTEHCMIQAKLVLNQGRHKDFKLTGANFYASFKKLV